MEEILAGRPLDPDTALAWWRLGQAYKAMRDLHAALQAFTSAGEAYEGLQEWAAAGDSLVSLARARSGLHDHAGSVRAYRHAHTLFRRAGATSQAARAETALAAELARCGFQRAALRAYERAQESFSLEGDPLGVATCLAGVGRVLADLGRARDALDAYDDAKQTFSSCREWSRVARCSLDQASILRELGDLTAALSRLDEAKALFERVDDRSSLAECSLTRADVLCDASRTRECFEHLDAARRYFMNQDDRRRLAGLDLREGLALLDMDALPAAMGLLTQAQSAYEEMGDALGAAYASLGLGRGFLQGGRPDSATEQFSRALKRFSSADVPAAQVAALHGLAESCTAAGRPDQALGYYLEGCSRLEGALDRVGTEESDAAGLRQSLPDCFGPAIRESLSRTADATEAFWLVERARSCRFRQELAYSVSTKGSPVSDADPHLVERWREVRRRLNALGTGATRARLRLQLDAIEARLFRATPARGAPISQALPDPQAALELLGQDEGLVEYHRDGSDLVCFLVQRSGVREAKVIRDGLAAATAATTLLAAHIAECERSAGPGPHAGDWRPCLRKLGEILLAPVVDAGWLSDNTPIQRFTFVPVGELHSLPFSALGIPGMDRWMPLIRSREVAVLPQLSIRYFLSMRHPDGEGTLAIIDPDATLRMAEEEAELLRRLLPDADLSVSGKPFAVPAETFPTIAQPYRSLHVSCHGVFTPGAPLGSALLMAPDHPGAAPSLLTARQLYSVPSRFELIFAAACESGESLVLEGEAFLGLTRALLYLARWVVSALWKINERSSLALTQLFYQNLADGSDPVHALGAAQRVMLGMEGVEQLRVPGLDLSHPYHWAGLVAMG